MNFNVNSDGNHSNTNKTFHGTDLPQYEINGKSEIEAKENEQKEGQSENDTIKRSLVGFAWGVLAFSLPLEQFAFRYDCFLFMRVRSTAVYYTIN